MTYSESLDRLDELVWACEQYEDPTFDAVQRGRAALESLREFHVTLLVSMGEPKAGFK